MYIDPAWTTPHRPASYFHRYKLVFHLRVTITIKGETQMGSVSNKDSMGTNIALSYSSSSNLSLYSLL